MTQNDEYGEIEASYERQDDTLVIEMTYGAATIIMKDSGGAGASDESGTSDMELLLTALPAVLTKVVETIEASEGGEVSEA